MESDGRIQASARLFRCGKYFIFFRITQHTFSSQEKTNGSNISKFIRHRILSQERERDRPEILKSTYSRKSF